VKVITKLCQHVLSEKTVLIIEMDSCTASVVYIENLVHLAVERKFRGEKLVGCGVYGNVPEFFEVVVMSSAWTICRG
jgi:hypothetical protein